MRSSFLIVFIIFTAGFCSEAASQETTPSLELLETPKIKPYSYDRKNFLYGSLSPIPGVGISSRTRSASAARAFDGKIGVASLPLFFGGGNLPILTVDYNFLYYIKDAAVSPYVSGGIGMAYIIPYIPLRAGIEFDRGFIDVGTKCFYGGPFFIFPSPEIRGGMNISF